MHTAIVRSISLRNIDQPRQNQATNNFGRNYITLNILTSARYTQLSSKELSILNMSRGNNIESRYEVWTSKYKGIVDDEGIKQIYDDWAETYDEIVMSPVTKHDGREFLMASLQRIVTNKHARILDFTSGTGIMGDLASNVGYTNIDALDGSKKSIEVARKKNVYTKLMMEWIGEDKLNIEDDAYDVLICSGGFATNHLSTFIFPEWIRIVKPGGYIFNSTRHCWLDQDPRNRDGKFDDALQKLEDERKWKLIEKRVNKNEVESKDTILVVHQIC